MEKTPSEKPARLPQYDVGDKFGSGSVAAFHVMIKPRGAVCNLNCSYCYYLPKKRLYPGSQYRMDDNILETFTRQYIEAQQTSEVIFAWQGGEPTLMGLDFFQRALHLQRRYCPDNKRIHNTIQTNGTLLDDEWCAFLKQHDFLVGLSLDGPRQLHDAYRLDTGGRSSFDGVMAGLRHLKHHQVEFNILTCIHAANAAHASEVYYFLRDEIGAGYIQFIPIVAWEDDTTSNVTDQSIQPKQYAKFMITIFDEWLRKDVGHVFVQPFDTMLAAWVGIRPGLCAFEETCGQALALEHNGDLYSCDHFVEPGHFLGNICEVDLGILVRSEQQRRFGHAKQTTLPRDCWECKFRFACNGGCPKNRHSLAAEKNAGLNHLCDGFKDFFKHIDPAMRFMAAELRSGRAPANIMNSQVI